MAIDNRLHICLTMNDVEENFNRILEIVDKIAENTECTVTFDSDGGSSVATQEVKYNHAATEPDDPTKSHYVFGGWYKGTELYDFDEPVLVDITLKAKWTPESYTVTFDSDGGSAVPAQTVVYNETATEPEDPTKEDKVFDGWYNGASEFDFATAITENTTLTAHWSDPVTPDPEPDTQGEG